MTAYGDIAQELCRIEAVSDFNGLIWGGVSTCNGRVGEPWCHLPLSISLLHMSRNLPDTQGLIVANCMHKRETNLLDPWLSL